MSVADGSASDSRERGLTAAQLTPKLRRQIADLRGRLCSAISGDSGAPAVGALNATFVGAAIRSRVSREALAPLVSRCRYRAQSLR